MSRSENSGEKVKSHFLTEAQLFVDLSSNSAKIELYFFTSGGKNFPGIILRRKFEGFFPLRVFNMSELLSGSTFRSLAMKKNRFLQNPQLGGQSYYKLKLVGVTLQLDLWLVLETLSGSMI